MQSKRERKEGVYVGSEYVCVCICTLSMFLSLAYPGERLWVIILLLLCPKYPNCYIPKQVIST